MLKFNKCTSSFLNLVDQLKVLSEKAVVSSEKKMSIKRQVACDEDEEVSLQLDRVWRNVFEKYDLDKDDKISLDSFKLFLKEKNHELTSDVPSEVLGNKNVQFFFLLRLNLI